MKRAVVCILSATLVAQIWGMFSWMALPWHNWDIRQFRDDIKVADVIRNEVTESGIYLIPNMDESLHSDEAAMAEWNKRASEGPFVFMSVRANGIEPGMGKPMAIGLLINLVSAILLFWLLGNTSIVCPRGRTAFLAVAGGVGGLYPHLSHWNWWNFPASYCFVGAIDLFLTWGLAGFVMVKLSDKLAPAN